MRLSCKERILIFAFFLAAAFLSSYTHTLTSVAALEPKAGEVMKRMDGGEHCRLKENAKRVSLLLLLVQATLFAPNLFSWNWPTPASTLHFNLVESVRSRNNSSWYLSRYLSLSIGNLNVTKTKMKDKFRNKSCSSARTQTSVVRA